MKTENQAELIKQRLEEHTSAMKEKFEDAFNRSLILKSLDLVALEAMRLEIPEWHQMNLGDLRIEIKKRQDLEKEKKRGAV